MLNGQNSNWSKKKCRCEVVVMRFLALTFFLLFRFFATQASARQTMKIYSQFMDQTNAYVRQKMNADWFMTSMLITVFTKDVPLDKALKVSAKLSERKNTILNPQTCQLWNTTWRRAHSARIVRIIALHKCHLNHSQLAEGLASIVFFNLVDKCFSRRHHPNFFNCGPNQWRSVLWISAFGMRLNLLVEE